MSGLTIPVYGSKMEWGNDGIAFTSIPKCKNMVIPEVSKDYRDVTTLDSPNGFREWQKGLKDGGEITLEANYSKALYAAAALKEALSGPVYFRVTLPADDDQSAGDVFEFTGHVTPSVTGEGVDGDVMMAIAIRTTGNVSWVQGAAL